MLNRRSRADGLWFKSRAFRATRTVVDSMPSRARIFSDRAEVDFFFFLHELGKVGHIKKGVAFKPYVHKGRLHARQHFHYAALVQVSDYALVLVPPLDVKFRYHAVFEH